MLSLHSAVFLKLIYSTSITQTLDKRSADDSEGLSGAEIACLVMGSAHCFDRVERIGMLDVEKSQYQNLVNKSSTVHVKRS
jgi:hypothetical protein